MRGLCRLAGDVRQELSDKTSIVKCTAAIAKAISAFFIDPMPLPLSKGLTVPFIYLKFRGITP
jgi:hypothetical protein